MVGVVENVPQMNIAKTTSVWRCAPPNVTEWYAETTGAVEAADNAQQPNSVKTECVTLNAFLNVMESNAAMTDVAIYAESAQRTNCVPTMDCAPRFANPVA